MPKSFFLNLFFPIKECSFCGKDVSNKYISNSDNYLFYRLFKLPGICTSCKEQLLVPQLPFCRHCHKPLTAKVNNKNDICNDCDDLSHKSFIFNRSAILYNDYARELIALYKYRGKQSLVKVFSQLLMITYEYYFKDLKIDYLTFVPIHKNRLLERGFNQAELLTIELHKLLGIPLIDCLERKKDTDKQSKQGKKERFRQIEDSFMIKENVGLLLVNKNILIIDDIYTTGATIIECANVLKIVKARNIYSLTLSRAYDI